MCVKKTALHLPHEKGTESMWKARFERALLTGEGRNVKNVEVNTELVPVCIYLLSSVFSFKPYKS